MACDVVNGILHFHNFYLAISHVSRWDRTVFSVMVMVRAIARVTLRVEVMVTAGFKISGRPKTRTADLTMQTIFVPCSNHTRHGVPQL